MVPFILASALSFALYQFLAISEFSQFPSAGTQIRVKGFRVNLDESSLRLIQRLVRIAIVFIALILIIVLHEFVSEIPAISRNKVPLIIGFFFGSLFAIWLNTVIAHPPGESLTMIQAIGGVGLILLFIAGSFGNEFGEVIRKYAANISTLKLGGAEFSFYEKDRKQRDPALGAAPLPGHSPSFIPSNGSSGLRYLSQLESIISRDKEYVRLFNNQEIGDLEQSDEFVARMLTAPVKCLGGWLGATADNSLVNRHLGGFADGFRQLEISSTNDLQLKAARNLVRSSLLAGSDVVAAANGAEIEEGCNSLLKLYCPAQVKGNTSDPVAVDKSPIIDCFNRSLQETETDFQGQASLPANGLMQELAEHTKRLNQEGRFRKRPYLVVAYSSIMAQLGQYEAAGAAIDGWLRELHKAQEAAKPSVAPSYEPWLELRARSMLAAYMEEWLRREGSTAPTVLRNEHLDNLDVIRNGFRKRLVNAPFFREATNELRSRDITTNLKGPNECISEDNSNIRIWRQLFTSYVSMELTYLQTLINHPEYGKKYAEKATSEARKLASFDVSCVLGDDVAETMYAQILESFARNALMYSKIRAENETDDTKRQRLTEADHVARFGLELIDVPAKQAQKRQGTFITRIAPDEAVETQEHLTDTYQDIQKALHNLS